MIQGEAQHAAHSHRRRFRSILREESGARPEPHPHRRRQFHGEESAPSVRQSRGDSKRDDDGIGHNEVGEKDGWDVARA